MFGFWKMGVRRGQVKVQGAEIREGVDLLLAQAEGVKEVSGFGGESWRRAAPDGGRGEGLGVRGKMHNYAEICAKNA